jgi:hypothetical protein
VTADFSDFVAEAERLRLNGDAHAAVKIAEVGLESAPDDPRGRMALALALIDLGDILEAREQLAGALTGAAATGGTTPSDAPAPPADPDEGIHEELRDDELERAFAAAETNPDDMMDANRVVEQTLRAADLLTPEPEFDVTNHPTYATESMASLLDEQGQRAEAEALRESLAANGGNVVDDPDEATWEKIETERLVSHEGPSWAGPGAEYGAAVGLGPDHARRLQVVATLEGWLHNLRRNAENDARSRASAGGQSREAAGGAA